MKTLTKTLLAATFAIASFSAFADTEIDLTKYEGEWKFDSQSVAAKHFPKTANLSITLQEENKKKCGRKVIQLPAHEVDYIKEKVTLGWTPDVIIGRKERPVSCGMRTLYRLFSKGIFDIDTLPMKGKRKPNGHQEKRGKQQYQRSIHDRPDNYPDFNSEFGHLEGDTIVGIHHKSAVITLVERLSKVIITIKPNGRKALDIETALFTL